MSATPSHTSFRQVGQTHPWKIPALCLIPKKDLAIYFQMLHWCLSSSKLSVLKRLLKMAAGYAGIMLQLQSQQSSLCMQSAFIYYFFYFNFFPPHLDLLFISISLHTKTKGHSQRSCVNAIMLGGISLMSWPMGEYKPYIITADSI